MTVISSFSINNCPILLGDLLVSGDENLQLSLSIPTIGEITKVFPKGSGFVPTGLTQKIAIMNDNLALAWAGSRISAKIIIGNLLKEAQKKSNWNFDDLSYFFADYDKEYGDDINFIGYSNDGERIFSFGYGTNQIKYNSENYGLVRLCGSGAINLRSSLNHFDNLSASRTTNPLESAVANTLVITTYMTGKERITCRNLSEYYGGGFEILSFVRRKFKKIDDITYLVWIGRQLRDLSWELSPPEICIKYYYLDDMLLIKRAEFKTQKRGTLTCDNEAVHIVTPIYRNANDVVLENINLSSFNSIFLCSFIILYCIDGSIEILNRINYSGDRSHLIKFIDNNKDILQIDINSNYIKSIFDSVMATNKMQQRK
jgi:hypothetical protein